MTHLFLPGTVTFRGTVLVPADVEQAFPLFSPVGETGWVPGWQPELLHPAGVDWAEGQIFRTRETTGEVVWIVTRLDRAQHRVEYHRVEPGRYVARVKVACRALDRQSTEATVEYSFVGLSEAGNRDIALMTPQDYDAKMARWGTWIANHMAAPP